MLIKEKENEFLKKFQKSFKNFCFRSPVILSFKCNPVCVYVKEYTSNEIKTFNFDYNLTVKENIKIIKDWLIENKYPVMIETKIVEEDYNTYEYNKMIESGKISIEDIPFTKKTKNVSIRWRIEKIIIKKDEFIIRNLENNKMFRYKMKMPSTLFMKKLREKLDDFQAFDLFKEKTVLLNEVYEDYQGRNVK